MAIGDRVAVQSRRSERTVDLVQAHRRSVRVIIICHDTSATRSFANRAVRVDRLDVDLCVFTDLRLRQEEAGQPVRDSKNWWPGFQGGPTQYVWNELPPSMEDLMDHFPPDTGPRL